MRALRETLADSLMADSDGAAKRRLNERLTIAIELAAALHQSRGVGCSLRAATDAATQTDAAPVPVDDRNGPALAAHFAPAHAVLAAPAPVNEYVSLSPALNPRPSWNRLCRTSK